MEVQDPYRSTWYHMCCSPQSWQSTVMAVHNHGSLQQSTVMGVLNHGCPGSKSNVALSPISIALLCSKYGIELPLRVGVTRCVEFCVVNACQ